MTRRTACGLPSAVSAEFMPTAEPLAALWAQDTATTINPLRCVGDGERREPCAATDA